MLEDSNSILKGLTNCQKNNKIAGRSIELISIGFWCSTYGDFIDNVMDYDLGWPHPRAIVDFNWERERRSEILNYLKSGISIQAYNGWSNCRFSCAEEYLGTEDFTDGMWLWPEGLSHYVEVHHVRLPEAFIIHMAKNHFKVPNLHLDEYEKKQTFTKYWVQWCAENTPPPSAETSSLTIKQATKVANKFSTETYNADICQTFGRWRLLETLGNKHYLDYAPPLSQLSLGIRLLRNRSLQKNEVIDIEHANLITSQYDTSAKNVRIVEEAECEDFDGHSKNDRQPDSLTWVIQEEYSDICSRFSIRAQDEVGWRYYLFYRGLRMKTNES